MLNFLRREKDSQKDRQGQKEQRSNRRNAHEAFAQDDAQAPLIDPEFPDSGDAQELHDLALEASGHPYAALAMPAKLEGALGRAANHWYYGEGTEGEKIANAAGALAHGIGAAQAFEDGNKRAALMTTRKFLDDNGYGHLSPLESEDEELADHLIGHGHGTHSLEDTQALFRSRLNPEEASERTANILDPIHDQLDPRVWDNPALPEPTLKHEHVQFIHEKIFSTLENHGYDGMENWLTLVFTGSLTTYQYSDESDVDISLFVDTKVFPEWSRAEIIGIMIDNCDGTKLPGTPFPLQCFVVAQGIEKTDLYKPGLRSGYDLATDTWIVPPDRTRVHDVEHEMNEAYTIALENADKMDRLLRYEPDKAVQFWHQIHKRRQRDMKRGRGDYAPSNITYKMLSNRGLFPQISDVSGEYIAKASMANGIFYHVAPSEHRQQIEEQGLVPSYDAPVSPWANATWDRSDQPSGVYLWDNPMNAKGYAYVLDQTKGGDPYPGDKSEFDYDDYERYMEGAPQDEQGYQDYSDAYTPSPWFDIWKVDARGLPVQIDPEMALEDGTLTPDEAQAEINRQVKEYGEPSRREGHRWYIPHGVPPDRISLHQAIFPGDLTEDDFEDTLNEGKQIPDAWHRVPLNQWNERARKRYLGSLLRDERQR